MSLRTALPLFALLLSLGCGQTEAPPEAQGGAGAQAAGAGGGGASSGGGQGGTTPAGNGGISAGGNPGAGAAGTDAGAAGSSGSAGASVSGDLPCDVEKFLVKRCQFCHADPPKYGATVPLMTLADLLAPSFSDPATTTAEMALLRMQDKKNPMPDPPNPAATAAEIAMMKAWIEAGTPARAPGASCDGAGGTGGTGGANQGGAAGASTQGGAGGSPAGAGGSDAGGTNSGGSDAGASSAGSSSGGTGGSGDAGGSDAGGSSSGGSDAGSAGNGGAAGDGGASGNAQGGTGQGGAGQGGSQGGTVCEDVVMKPSSAWQMPQNDVDRYACYGFDVPKQLFKRQLVRVTPQINNETIVHHLLLLSAPTSQPTKPTTCDSLPPLDWRLLYAWAPGTPTLELPSEAGYPVEDGETMHLVLQVHYSNLKKLAGQSDSSGVSLCLTDQLRPFDADIMAFGSINFSLGPHQTTKLRCASDAPTSSTMTFFQSWPHMHTYGSAFDSRVRHPDGSEEILATTENYSFYDQITYPNQQTIKAGDKIITTCTWNNQSSDTVPFGEATSEEMCFNFVSYYPRITSNWNWIFPSYTADCQKIP